MPAESLPAEEAWMRSSSGPDPVGTAASVLTAHMALDGALNLQSLALLVYQRENNVTIQAIVRAD